MVAVELLNKVCEQEGRERDPGAVHLLNIMFEGKRWLIFRGWPRCQYLSDGACKTESDRESITVYTRIEV